MLIINYFLILFDPSKYQVDLSSLLPRDYTRYLLGTYCLCTHTTLLYLIVQDLRLVHLVTHPTCISDLGPRLHGELPLISRSAACRSFSFIFICLFCFGQQDSHLLYILLVAHTLVTLDLGTYQQTLIFGLQFNSYNYFQMFLFVCLKNTLFIKCFKCK